MSELRYTKGVRTRYRNILEEEIINFESLIRSDIQFGYKEEILSKVNKCLKKMEFYREKLEVQSKALCCAIGDTDEDLLNTVLEEDGDLCERIIKCSIDLGEFKETLMETVTKKEEKNIEQLVYLQTDMQRMVLDQMKHQQEFFEKQEEIRHHHTSVRLPKLEMASFDGDKIKWTEFWDSFECTVHSNNNLSGIEKMNYLRSKLTGEAKSAIDGLELSNKNYVVAINILKERFGKIQEVIDLHYSRLINLPAPKDTTESLRIFLNEIEKHMRSLVVLKQDVNQTVFVSMIKSKLPNRVLVQFEMQKDTSKPWTTYMLRDMLSHYVVALESADVCHTQSSSYQQTGAALNRSNSQSHRSNRRRSNSSFKTVSGTAEALVASDKQNLSQNTNSPKYSANTCRYCSKQHYSDECLKYKTVAERKRKIKGSCYRCLREGHIANECKRNIRCVHCGEQNKHHRSLCAKEFRGNSCSETLAVNLTENTEERKNEVVVEENSLVSSNEMVLMQTALTEVKSPDDSKCQKTRVLLDCGSQRTYITMELARKLGLKREQEQEIMLSTFGSDKTKLVKTSLTTLSLKLHNGLFVKVTANIVPVISGNIVRKHINLSSVGHVKHLLDSVDLADTIPRDNESSSVELLIGNDYYLDLILPQRIELVPGLYLLSSKFGWILTGRTDETNAGMSETNCLILTYSSNLPGVETLQNVDCAIRTKPDLEDFWNIEAIGITDDPVKNDDEKAMEHFKETLKFEDGRYQVTWPWKDDTIDLPVNRTLAMGRLKSCVKKLKRNPELLKRYNSVLQEQLENGIIEKVQESETNQQRHYIPHHPVVTPFKTTTKLRLVYDASAKANKDCTSLNECLFRGPVMLHNLCGMLLRFRLHKVALVADIEKAFHQIGLQPSERDVTRFLWLKNFENPIVDHCNIQEYTFCRVPFGIISSPFLLGATVEQHLERSNTAISTKIKNDIYVDNLVTGTDSDNDAIQLYLTSKSIFWNASMNLREWLSNSDQVNSTIPEYDRVQQYIMCVLGHTWNSQCDVLSIKKSTNLTFNTMDVTKRNILKVIASVFDPMGLFTPIVLRGKLLLQTIWIRNMDWDETIEDPDIAAKWLDVGSDLEELSQINVKRCISHDISENVKYDLLCFCDASSHAYATAVYLHQTNNGMTKTDLIFAKSRLTPLKGLTIPRLELMAVLIGVRSLHFVKEQLMLSIDKQYLWTDSQCVLGWLNTEKKLDVFVKNRVVEIKKHDLVIGYINSQENPADVATRGTTVRDLCEKALWWHGPSWLKTFKSDIEQKIECTANDLTESEKQMKVLDDREDRHIKTQTRNTTAAPFSIDSFDFSSITKLFRVTAIAKRFTSRLRHQPSETGSLKASELKDSEQLWLKHIQRKHFSEDIDAILNGKSTNLQRQLGLYLDNVGLLRSKGRLQHSSLSEGARCPILLPSHEIGYAPRADAEITYLDEYDFDQTETLSAATSLSQRSSVVTADSGRASSQSTIKSSNKTEKDKEKKKSKKMVVCRIALLDGRQFEPASVDKNCTGQSVFDKVAQHLDVIETDYFGLTYRDKTGKKYWLDHTKKVSKQLQGGTWVFEFQVKFYPPDPMSLKEDITRYQLCLQLRVDIFNGRIPCSFVTCALLGSYTVQSELGDWEPSENYLSTGYLNDFDFSPSRAPELLDKIAELHRHHKGQTPIVAEAHFLENAKKLALYGVDMHDTKDSDNQDIQLGVCASGILVYKDRLRINRYVWPKILKLSYKRNIFYVKIRPVESDPQEKPIGFKCETHKLAKRLWKACVEHHAFFRLKDADAPPSNTMFPRFTTKFRYSGRTAAQARKAAEMSDREEPHITRTAERKSMNLGHNKSKSLDELERKRLEDEKDKMDQKSDPNATANYDPNDAAMLDKDGKYLRPPGSESEDRQDRWKEDQDKVQEDDGADAMYMEQKPKPVQKWELPGIQEMMQKGLAVNKLKEDYTQLLRETPDITSTSDLNDVKHKIDHDPRYCAVPSDDLREDWFNEYTKDMMKKNYMRLLRETPQIHSQSRWPEARQEIDLDPRFQAVPLEALREEWFNEYIQDLVKSEFMQLLKETPAIHSQSRWEAVKDHIDDDPRYKAVKNDAQREAWFDEYIQNLKKEEFKQLLRETPDITSYSRYPDVKEDLSQDPRFHNVDTDAQREEYFKEYVQDLKKAGYVQLLKDTPDITAYSSWYPSRQLIDTDPRYHAVDTDLQRAKWFNEYVNNLAGIGDSVYDLKIGDYKSIDRNEQFLPLTEPSVTVKTPKDEPMPFFQSASEADANKRKPPPIARKPKHQEGFESEEDRAMRTSVTSSTVPVTVETETYKFNPDTEDTPRSTSNIPIVETKTHKVTYEKDGIPYETEDSILISAHSVTTKSQTIDTTTYKTERDGVVETRVERKVTVTSDGDFDLDHDALLRAAIEEVTNMNQGLEVEKIECVKQIEEVNGK